VGYLEAGTSNFHPILCLLTGIPHFEGLMDRGFCYVALEKLCELLGNYGAVEKVTLPLGASLFLQKMPLFFGLHSLGDRAMLEALSDIDERAQNRGIIRMGGNVIDEVAVHWQGMQGKFSQITETGIAHPQNHRLPVARQWFSARAAFAPLITIRMS
jgi:hypothetical protein